MDRNDRQERLDNMKALVAFLEQHDNIPLPYWRDQYVYLGTKQQVMDAVRGTGIKWDKKVTDYSFNLITKFGDIEFTLSVSRNEVCTSKVVGKKIIPFKPAEIIQAVPEHEEDILEWECAPLGEETEDNADDKVPSL